MLVLKILWLFSITLLMGSDVKSQKIEAKVDSNTDPLTTSTERASNPEVPRNIPKQPLVQEQSNLKSSNSEVSPRSEANQPSSSQPHSTAGEGSENVGESIDAINRDPVESTVAENLDKVAKNEETWSSMNMPSNDETKEENASEDVNDESATVDNPEEDQGVNVDAIIDETAEAKDPPADLAEYEEENPESEAAVEEDQENEEIAEEVASTADETVDDIFNQPNPDLESPQKTTDIPESDVINRWLAEQGEKEAIEENNPEMYPELTTTEENGKMEADGSTNTEALTASSPAPTDQSTLQFEETKEDYTGNVSADSTDDSKTKHEDAQTDAELANLDSTQVADSKNKFKLVENKKLTSEQGSFIKSTPSESMHEKDETTTEASTTSQAEEGSTAKPESKNPAVPLTDNSQINQAPSKKTDERKHYQKPPYNTPSAENEKEESAMESSLVANTSNTKQNITTSQKNRSKTMLNDQSKTIPQQKTSEENIQRGRTNYPQSNVQAQQEDTKKSLNSKIGRKLENTEREVYLPRSEGNFHPVNTGSFESQILKPTEVPLVEDKQNTNLGNKNKTTHSFDGNYKKTSVEQKQPHRGLTNDEIGRSSKLVLASTDHPLPENERMVQHFSRMAFPEELDSVPSSTSANNIKNDEDYEQYFYYGDMRSAEGTLYASLNVSMGLLINDTRVRLTPSIFTQSRHEAQKGYITFKWYGIDDTYNISTAFEMQCKHGYCFIDGIQVNATNSSNPEAEEITAAKSNLELFTSKIGTVFEDNKMMVLHMAHGITIQLHYVGFSPYEDINELFSSGQSYLLKDYYSEIIGGSVGILLLGVAVLYVVRKWSKGRNHFKPTLA